jgi:predicted transcriptional regulator
MADLILPDLEPMLVERIDRVAQVRGWTRQAVLLDLIEHGLFQREEEIRGGVRFAGGGCLVRCHPALQALLPGRDL